MFKAILKTQWKWTRGAVLLGVVAGFAIPLLSVSSNRDAWSARILISSMQTWGTAYALLAGAVGLFVAWQAWSSDHRGHHVYALSLPVARWRYVLLRFGAGVVFLVPVVVALAVGTLLAVGTVSVPDGLHVYPMALTLRFAFAALVAYAIFFGISAASARAAGVILGAVVVVIAIEFLTDAIGLHWNVGGRAIDFLMVYPGILSVFSGRWTLIDV
jgi:hypothetical protein